MITTAWMMDVDRDTNYLECRKEEFGNEPRENRVDVVKVYFDSVVDVIVTKKAKLEMTIAETIFSKRAMFAKEIVACLEAYSNGVFFRTGTTTLLPKEFPQSTLRELEMIQELGGEEEK